MMPNKTLSLVLVLFLTGHLQAVFAQKKAVAIPFRMTSYNNIAVQAILNKTDTVQLMFHTAASGVIMTAETLSSLKSLHFNGKDSVSSWGGGGNTSRYSNDNSLQIGTFTWDSLSIWEDKYSGQETGGKFGMDLFANRAVEIDFDKKRLLLYSTLPHKARRYKQLDLINENGSLFIEAICEAGEHRFKHKFLLHSGYAGTVLLDDKTVNDNGLSQALKITDTKELKDAFGHILKVQKAILPQLQLGNETLYNVPVGFFEGALGRQKISIFGMEILKRFNIIIDAGRTHIYLKENGNKSTAFS